MRILIEDLLANRTFEVGGHIRATQSSGHPAAWLGVGALASVLVGGVAMWIARSEPSNPVSRTTINLEGSLERIETIALSQDGRRLAYAANGRLYLRPMDQLESKAIPGTEGGTSPFFSPDGQSVGFFTPTQLKRVDLAGGAPTVLADVQRGLGGAWGPDGRIVFGREGEFDLFSVLANGGGMETFADLADHYDIEFPEFLPGGEWVLFTDNVDSIEDWNNSNIVAQSVRTSERKLVLERGQMARYSPTGHLVFARDGWLFGVGFDVDHVVVVGEPVALIDGLAVENHGVTTKFALARNGTLVYAPRTTAERTLVWVDREGPEEPIGLPARDYYWPRLSPDGAWVAVSVNDTERNVWVSELARGTLTNLTTDARADDVPIWTPDGKRIVFASTREGSRFAFFSKRADGTGAAERLLLGDGAGYTFPFSWSADGSTLAFQYLGPTTESDIGVHTMDGDGTWAPLLATRAREMHPAISPDGAWIAYTSELAGTSEVYIERFPNLGDRRQVSTGGGRAPVWSRSGHELFYRRSSDRAMMVVPIDYSPTPKPGEAEYLFDGSSYSTGSAVADDLMVNYDVLGDGERFLMIKDSAALVAGKAEVFVIQNWSTELTERVPVN